LPSSPARLVADFAVFAAACAPLDADLLADFARRPEDFAELPPAFAELPPVLAARPLVFAALPLAFAALPLALEARPDALRDRLALLFSVADGPLPLPLDDLRVAEPAVLPLVAELELEGPEDPFEDDLFRDEARAVPPR
jgi:hypothetical protein